MADRRNRPWKKLRVVVEVTVPPTNRATEKTLKHYLEDALDRSVMLPNRHHKDAYEAPIRVKMWSRVFPVARIAHKIAQQRNEPL